MQELLGRISRLDSSASLGLRVIACFDELVVGNVNTRALISAAAALAGCVCGFEQDTPHRMLRVDPRGEAPTHAQPPERTEASADEGLLVWLEREGAPLANDAIILERLALAVRIRHGRGQADPHRGRDLATLLDGTRELDERCTAATRLGIAPNALHRVVAAPLFAVWSRHPGGPEDVVPTRFGPIHALVVPARIETVEAAPAGIGIAATASHLFRSFQTALTALRLSNPPQTPVCSAHDYGGLVELLADMPEDGQHRDADLLETLYSHTWADGTIDALVRAGSLRQAARDENVHHKTMQGRVEIVADTLGFDPLNGHGRTRLGIAYLIRRLRLSRVLDLPSPSAQANPPSTV